MSIEVDAARIRDVEDVGHGVAEVRQAGTALLEPDAGLAGDRVRRLGVVVGADVPAGSFAPSTSTRFVIEPHTSPVTTTRIVTEADSPGRG